MPVNRIGAPGGSLEPDAVAGRRVGFTGRMPLRGRLLALASRAAALANERRVVVAGRVLLLAGLLFLAVRLRSIWHDSRVDLGGVGWAALVGAFLASAAGVAASGVAWLAILRGLGVRTRLRWAGVMFQAQLAKYIPGTVWQYAGRAALARGRGIPMRPVGVSLPVELGVSLAVAGALSALLLGGWGIGVALAVVAAAALAARWEGLPRPLRAGAATVPLFALVWIAIGAGFWLTARALLGVPFDEALVYAGAFCAAWVVGVAAVFAPGGIGVREAMLVAILHGRLGSADALVLAAVSRGILTLVDLLAAGVGVLLISGGPVEEQVSRG